MEPEVHMNTETMRKRLPSVPLLLLPLLAFALLWSGSILAQVPVDEEGNPIESLEEHGAIESRDAAANPADEEPPLTQDELEELVGPIALYPDKLLAIVLPASTYPLEIVQAARFLEQLEEDSSLKPDESWDDSVTALLNYPEVIKMMDEDIDWTWRLGEAVVRQQPDVIAAVESFRDRAYAAGNLKTDERQRVFNNGEAIEIQPLEEDIIYVPYYEPERVVHYQPRQVYYYYPRPYPVYYYPYPAYHSFLSGYFWGVTTAFSIGWTTDHLHVFHHSYWGHPYYGRQYFGHYYRRPSIVVYNTYYSNSHRGRSNDHHRYGDYWRPRDGGPRPGQYRDRLERFGSSAGNNPRVRTTEGYRMADRDGRRAASETGRAGFGSDAGAAVRSVDRVNSSREGFAPSGRALQNRDRATAADRVVSRARQAEGSASRGTDDAPIRFRPREGTAAPVQSDGNRSTGAVVRTPERAAVSRATERRAGNDEIRFRPRDNEKTSKTSRQRPAAGPPAVSRETAPARAADRAGSVNRGVVRDRSSRTAAAPAARSAPLASGFRASPGRSAPAARSSQPQVSPRAAPAPRQSSTPRAVPAPSASAPARAPRASQSVPRQDRAAPPRRSSGTAPARTSREH
jgi:hypothetical protein